MINVSQKSPLQLQYNSFVEANRRREAAAALDDFIKSFEPLSTIRKNMCADDIRCIVEMIVEERRANMKRIANPYFITEQTEIAEYETV
jgi:hypothetical protein